MTTEQKKVLDEAVHEITKQEILVDSLEKKVQQAFEEGQEILDEQEDEELQKLIEAEDCACGTTDCECELCDGSGLTVVGAYDDLREVECPCVTESKQDTEANNQE